jgi:hypothetical protein
MRHLFTAVIIGVAVLAVFTASSAAAGQFVPTVRCGEIGLYSKTGEGEGYRKVLGAVSAPPRYIAGGTVKVPSSDGFSYWSKAGIWIHASNDAAVTVSLPKEWRARARIVWGAPGTAATAVRFEPCRSLGAAWDGYAGGFLLRSKSACIPLVFAVGNRRATLRFGIGRHC